MWTAPGDTVYISEVRKLAKWTDTSTTATTPAAMVTPTADASSTSNTATIITPATPTAADTSITRAPSIATTTSMQTVKSSIYYENNRKVKIIVLQLLNERLTERFGPTSTTISSTALSTDKDVEGDVERREQSQPSLSFFDPLLCPPPPPLTSSQYNSSSDSHKNEWTCGIVVCIPLRLGEGSTIAPIYIEV